MQPKGEFSMHRFRVLLVSLAIVSLIVGALYAGIAHGQTVDLAVTPVNGVGSVTPTLSWTSSGCGSLTAGGAWSGTKAASGSQVMPAITTTTTYSLSCSVASQSSATLSWTPPTQNTDGSALTNLANYKVFVSNTQAGVASVTPILIPAPASTYIVQSLSAGTWYFGVKSTNSVGVDSVMSNIATRSLAGGTTVSDSVTVAVTPAPQPPTGLTAISTVAFETRTKWGAYQVWREAGTIPFGTPCDSSFRISGTNYYAVPRDAVTPYRNRALTPIVVARCSG